ncbi:hypothetical protein ACFXKI_10120 [Streptomyces mirabilis]|uniref:hypothetical protein n=1 Tax=Streptomyces mirabilis TaxID=68239 RepID=UPI0036D01E14
MAPTSDDTARHLQKLAALVTQRRVALGLRSKEAGATACGIAPMTYRKIEGGSSGVSDTTYAKVEIGYGFRPGSCKAVLEGADSIFLEDGTELIEAGQIRDFANSEALEEEMDRAFDKSAQLVAPNLTLSESRAIKEGMFEYLRERGILKSK